MRNRERGCDPGSNPGGAIWDLMVAGWKTRRWFSVRGITSFNLLRPSVAKVILTWLLKNKDKMKKLFKFRYPKIFLLIISIIFAYYLFRNPMIEQYFSHLGDLSYIGIFAAGLLFSFGFTTPIAIGLFLTLNPPNIILASVLGGFGALLSDIFIFKIIKISFLDEFYRLEKTPVIKNINRMLKNSINAKIKNYLLYVFAGFIIASPLPDELGITMLAGLSHIKIQIFIVISFIMNTLGILTMLLLGSLI